MTGRYLFGIVSAHTVTHNYKQMRTKILLCAAAFAASAAISMAQNVYSLNIVGYVNVATPVGFTFQSNPLDAGVTNGANEVIPNTGQWDGCEIHEWTGVGYKVSVFDSATADTTTGFTDRSFNPVPPPVLNSGKGYLFNNTLGTAQTVTYVGQARVGTNALSFPASTHVYAVGAPVPVAGGVMTTLGLTNSAGSLDGCEVQTAVRNASGAIVGYQVSVYDSATADTTTGFTDRSFNPVPEPQIAVGQGFFFNNATAATVTWTQVLNNN